MCCFCRATEEMEKTRKSASSDIARLEAAVKKSDLQVQSLQKSLDQKIKENEELTSICDELIAKVGSWNSIITISWHMLMPHGHFIGERNIPTKFHVNWFRIGESNDDKCKIEIYKYGWRYVCWKNCCSSWKKCLKNHWCTCSYKPPMIFTPAF